MNWSKQKVKTKTNAYKYDKLTLDRTSVFFSRYRASLVGVSFKIKAAMENKGDSCVQLTVRPFGFSKDPITNVEQSVKEYIWTNSKTKTTVKVSVVE